MLNFSNMIKEKVKKDKKICEDKIHWIHCPHVSLSRQVSTIVMHISGYKHVFFHCRISLIFGNFWFKMMLKIPNGRQKSRPAQLPVRISPSSDGVEIKTGYVGLPTRRVLSRRLVFRADRKRKIHFRRRTKNIQFPENIVKNSLDGLSSINRFEISASH